MDIIVTTPKSQMANAAKEAADCIAEGGGEYFRRFPRNQSPHITIGDRVFYVEDGWIRGFAVVSRIANIPHEMQCDTTNRWYGPGFYVFMPADSWRWIRPIPHRGFQGFRYARREGQNPNTITHATEPDLSAWIMDAGGWLDPKPELLPLTQETTGNTTP